MIELTQLNGTRFVLNCDLIETIENIPETKVALTNGKYFLVLEKREEIIQKVIAFRRSIFKNVIAGEGRQSKK
jgi:flagellar protein FlbD